MKEINKSKTEALELWRTLTSAERSTCPLRCRYVIVHAAQEERYVVCTLGWAQAHGLAPVPVAALRG